MDSALKVYKHTDRDGAWFIAEPNSGAILIDNCTSATRKRLSMTMKMRWAERRKKKASG
jgi:hypothetical protein